jgi:tetratricopeptide (TPR) repeat protein
MLACCLTWMSWGELAQGELGRAIDLAEEALTVQREIGRTPHLLPRLHALAVARWQQGNLAEATALLEEAFILGQEKGARLDVAPCVEAMAALQSDAGRAERAARLWGAAEAMRESSGAPQPPNERMMLQEAMDRARTQLGEKGWMAAREEGRAMTLEQVAAYAVNAIPVPALGAQRPG